MSKNIRALKTDALPSLSPRMAALAIEVFNATDVSLERFEMIRHRIVRDPRIVKEMLDELALRATNALDDVERIGRLAP